MANTLAKAKLIYSNFEDHGNHGVYEDSDGYCYSIFYDGHKIVKYKFPFFLVFWMLDTSYIEKLLLYNHSEDELAKYSNYYIVYKTAGQPRIISYSHLHCGVADYTGKEIIKCSYRNFLGFIAPNLALLDEVTGFKVLVDFTSGMEIITGCADIEIITLKGQKIIVAERHPDIILLDLKGNILLGITQCKSHTVTVDANGEDCLKLIHYNSKGGYSQVYLRESRLIREFFDKNGKKKEVGMSESDTLLLG